MRASLEASVDELYKGPIGAFVAARTALARTLTGEEARRVRALQKPRVAPWAVNQLYWHARPLYDRVVRSGEKLRASQIAVLEGRRANLRRLTEAHHKAMGNAVTEASRLAAAAGVHPGAEELIRTFEALSLAGKLPESPGRLTRPLRPAGFEALAGIPVKARPSEEGRAPKETGRDDARDATRRASALKKAEAAVARAEAAEARARQQWERRRQALDAAARAFHDLSGKLTG